MATHSLDPAVFRVLFPEFGSETVYPDARIQVFWDVAAGVMGSADGCLIAGANLQNALNFMTAHFLKLSAISAGSGGGVAGVVTGATIDKVQVQLAAPPFGSGWEYWLSTTPYGVQLWALLQMMSAGGFSIGGSPEVAAFRRVGGRFGF